jgi:hypothetical protein
MTDVQRFSDWMNRTVRDTNGDKVGTIADITPTSPAGSRIGLQ